MTRIWTKPVTKNFPLQSILDLSQMRLDEATRRLGEFWRHGTHNSCRLGRGSARSGRVGQQPVRRGPGREDGIEPLGSGLGVAIVHAASIAPDRLSTKLRPTLRPTSGCRPSAEGASQ